MFLENTVNNNEKTGWIEVICGSMFSGKTEELIRRLRRAQFAKQKVEIFKPSFDTRYDDTNIVSHNANEIPSTPVEAAASIMLLADGCDVVGIDEAQFFDDEIVHVCTAEYVTKVHAVCTRTGNLANYSFRKVSNDQQRLLGEADSYEPLSRAAFYKAMNAKKTKE